VEDGIEMATKCKIDVSDIQTYISNKNKKKGKSEATLKRGTALTAELVRELLDYNPDTGTVIWKVKHSAMGKAGKVVGASKTQNYKTVYLYGISYNLHRVIWLMVYGKWPTKHIDHINGIRGDNRLINLREVTMTENQLNRTFHRKGGLPFTTYHKKDKKWRAMLPSTISKKHKISRYLGSFDTQEEAHDTVLIKLKKLNEVLTTPVRGHHVRMT
jgi:hypothetical protein